MIHCEKDDAKDGMIRMDSCGRDEWMNRIGSLAGMVLFPWASRIEPRLIEVEFLCFHLRN